MKTLTTEQFNALPEEKKHLWNRHYHPHEPSDYRIGYEYYTPIQINLEDAERVLEEAINKMNTVKNSLDGTALGRDFKHGSSDGFRQSVTILTTALNTLKTLVK